MMAKWKSIYLLHRIPHQGYAEFHEQWQRLENYRQLGPLRYFAVFLNSSPPIPIRQIAVKNREKLGKYDMKVPRPALL